MDDLLGEFLAETAEGLAELDLELVQLEQDPDDPELLGNIFRIVHTIKGTCGFFDLPRLEALAHAAENVLSRFRACDRRVTPEGVTLLLRSLDRINAILAFLEKHQQEPEGDDGPLIAGLNAAAAGGEQAAAATGPMSARRDPAAMAERLTNDEQPVDSRVVTSGPLRRDLAAASQNVRVSVNLLENLTTVVGELALTRNQLLQMLSTQEKSLFAAPLRRLDRITSELQEGVMRTRMQPVGKAWSKLSRIVRDLSRDLGKKVELETEGAETELDRQVLELIKGPLTHIVRNAIAHGVEDGPARQAAGKPRTARIALRAFHQDDQIVIEVSDDGRGLAIRKIRQKAVASGLVTATEAEAMPDHLVQEFIFRAGFSTAEEVTKISGRGVGLDVVRANIETIGGTVGIRTTAGHGTVFTITIPRTLDIVRALVVESAGHRFAVPQASVLEIIRISGAPDCRVESIDDTACLRMRESLLPLIELRSLLGLGDGEAEGVIDRRDGFALVGQVGAYSVGIVVDQVSGTEEIVVKPIAPALPRNGIFSGNTVLGDGSVVMILDPNGIAEGSGLAASASQGSVGAAEQTDLEARDILDLGCLPSRTFDDRFGTEKWRARSNPRRKILLVDDSAFFRNLLSPLLKSAGYDVTAVESGQQALSFCESGREFDVIVSDIEMPEMDGYAFAEAVRRTERWQDVPLVAISSRTGSHEHRRGRDAGFDEYIPKLDRAGLLDALASHSVYDPRRGMKCSDVPLPAARTHA